MVCIIGDGIFDKVTNKEVCDVVWKQPKDKIKENDYEKWTKRICEDIVDKAIQSGSNDNLSCVFIAFKHYFNMLNKEKVVNAKENITKLKCDNMLIDSVIDINNDVSNEYESVFDKTDEHSHINSSNDNDNTNTKQQQQHVFKSYYSQFHNVDPKKTSLENYYGV